MTRSLFVIILFVFSLNGYSNEETYKVRFGYISQQENKTFTFLREADRVPIIPMNAGIYYGVEIKPSSNKPFTVNVSIFLPNDNIIKLPAYKFTNTQVIPMGFDTDDLEGQYKIEVKINSQIYEVFFDALTTANIDRMIEVESNKK